MGMEEIFGAMGGGRGINRVPDDKLPEHIEKLKMARARFAERHSFQPGDIVDWKKGLKNKACYGPFVVVEMLTEPLFDMEKEHGSGSTYWREPLDLVLGSVDGEGDFITFYYDSRRFELYEA